MNFKKILRPGIGQLEMYAPKKLDLPKNRTEDRKGGMFRIPKISIVVPSLNQGHFIEETLTSIIEQSYPNLELIVIDGGSSDNSLAIIKKLESNLYWWISEPDTGQTAAINKGFKQSTGEIMGWINSDDLMAPSALMRVAEHFQAHPATHAIYGNRILIDEHSLEIGRWILPQHSKRVLRWVDYVPQETLYWRRSAWNCVGSQLDENFNFAMDWDILLRFSAQGLKIDRLPIFLGLFRIHKAQKTLNKMATIGLEEMKEIRHRELGFVPSHLQIILNTGSYLLAAKFHEVILKLSAGIRKLA